ncbi:hypothetical protein DSO57_1018930 [Entomophthora muscae]|uniref:Uncharacterized protein n=1 Tax=Entomophthora muscae TaxID=34485 RepID=A0ACC2T4B7_9FUNG|nr:hypothetical protein DSO57_1018930 [Entomophthora muscae]
MLIGWVLSRILLGFPSAQISYLTPIQRACGVIKIQSDHTAAPLVAPKMIDALMTMRFPQATPPGEIFTLNQ